MKTLSGTPTVPFSTLVQSTIEVHGFAFAYVYYTVKHNVPEFEFFIFAGVHGVPVCDR